MTFDELLAAANAGNGRNSGQWTPRACEIWRTADPEMSRLLEAAFAWELMTGRRAQPRDLVEVRQRRQEMDAATAAARAAKEG